MGEHTYIFGKEFHQKWLTARPRSGEDRRSYARRKQAERIERILENNEKINSFANEIEKAGGGELARQLKRTMNRLIVANRVAELGVEAGKAAAEVESLLIGWYNTAYRECRQESGGDDDEYFICVARIDRRWQGRNLDWVLNVDRDNSWVNTLFRKWRDTILGWITPGG